MAETYQVNEHVFYDGMAAIIDKESPGKQGDLLTEHKEASYNIRYYKDRIRTAEGVTAAALSKYTYLTVFKP